MEHDTNNDKGSITLAFFWLLLALPAVSLPLWGGEILYSEILLGSVIAFVVWLLYTVVIGSVLFREFRNGQKNGWKW